MTAAFGAGPRESATGGARSGRFRVRSRTVLLFFLSLNNSWPAPFRWALTSRLNTSHAKLLQDGVGAVLLLQTSFVMNCFPVPLFGPF